MATATGVVYDPETGKWTARKLEAAEINSLDAAVITSGLIPHARVSGLPYANLELSGQILTADMGSGQIVAYHITTVDAYKITSGLVPHARLSGLPYANLELSGQIAAGDIGSGTIAAHHVTTVNASKLTSGLLAHARLSGLPYANLELSGQILTGDLASGVSVDIAEQLKEPNYAADEPISAYLAVYLKGDKKVGVAQCNDANKMPAMGIVTAALASGDTAAIWTTGRATGDPTRISGQYQKVVWVQTDGQLRTSAPSLSGNLQQRMGIITSDDEVMLYPSPIAVEIAA